MLDEIRAQNLGLIADAVLAPCAGLTVITGETGTGKTLMLGALRLVRGDNASKGTVGPHNDTADVAARLVLPGGTESVVRRVVTSKRSRAYIDGVPATATELSDRFGPFITIVGQHDQHTLATSEGVRRMVDAMFTPHDQQVFERYSASYRELQAVEAEMEMLGSDRRGLERELEMTRFQVAEIDEAAFSDGEEEALRSRLDRLRHAEEIATELAVVTDALGDAGTERTISQALTALERIARLDHEAMPFAQRLSQMAGDVSELTADVARYGSTIEGDPRALATDEQRLADLSALKRKYGDTIPDISAFAKAATERAATIEDLLEAAESLTDRHRVAIATLEAAATDLTAVRTRCADTASRGAHQHLRDLGFTEPLVSIEIEQKAPTATGADRLLVLFASDDSLEARPITAIASGGELSRLVLALTLASGGADAHIVAFDEIDAGIGGSTALAMGRKLAALALTRQVICVTHLPQVAAYGSCHFTVTRTGTTASIEAVSGVRRIEEISRMLAGMEGSQKARSHAEELLAAAAGDRPGAEGT